MGGGGTNDAAGNVVMPSRLYPATPNTAWNTPMAPSGESVTLGSKRESSVQIPLVTKIWRLGPLEGPERARRLLEQVRIYTLASVLSLLAWHVRL